MKKPEIKYELEISHGSKYGGEEEKALLEVLKNNAPSCGKKVKEFEEAFTEYCGCNFSLTVTSATTGLTLSGIAAGVGPGDEVITTPISWIATAMAYSVIGAKVIFCDVEPKTLNLDPEKLESLITDKTKAIIPVHLYGQCCKMDKIMDIAEKHNVTVIDDCAHAPGAEYKGNRTGSLAHMGVFSFHQQKNLCTLGEGGMVTFKYRKHYERALSYRSLCARTYSNSFKYLPIDTERYPMNKEYWRMQFDDIGYNFRMTDAQAAVGIEQLKKLDQHNERRRELADNFTEFLGDIKGLEKPYIDPDAKHVFHVYVVQLQDDFPMSKADFMWDLYDGKGIKAWSHYMPIHLTHPYREEGHTEGECPIAEDAYTRYVSFPIHPRLTTTAVEYMANSILELSGSSR